MLLLGERMDATEAHRIGIVNRVVPDAELDAAVAEWTTQARLQLTADDEARQGRDPPPAGHAARRRARIPPRTTSPSPSRPRTCARASPRSSRSGNRSGRGRMSRTAAESILASARRGPRRSAARGSGRSSAGRRQEKIDAQHAARQAHRARAGRRCSATRAPSSSSASTAGTHYSSSARWSGKEAPADGVITGYGKVDGSARRRSCAYDFTVMAGSMGMTGEFKVARLRELALTKRIPLVWLLDSAGARDPGGGRVACSPAPATCSARRS